MDTRNSGLGNPAPIRLALLGEILGRPVERDSLERWEALVCGVADGHQLSGGEHGAVPVGQEDGSHTVRPVDLERQVKILHHLLMGTDPERSVLVHGAERTAVVGASQGGLDDQRARFARGSVDGAFIAQALIPLVVIGVDRSGFRYSRRCSHNWEMIFCVEMLRSMV